MLCWSGLLLGSQACGGTDAADVSTRGPSERAASPAFSAASAPDRPAPFQFTDVSASSGLQGFRQRNGSAEKSSILESVGGGVGLLDADADGRLDVYLANGGGDRVGETVADAFYRGVGDGLHFEDASEAFGVGSTAWTNGVRTVDLDGDGWCDIYLTAYGSNSLLMNRAGRGFEDATEFAGIGDPSWSTGALFLDHDRDGDLDLYVANYVEFDAADPPPPSPQYKGLTVFFGPRGLPGARDTFYRNGGDGVFEEITEQAGLANSDGYAFQVVCFDSDEDGWLDVFVANDSTPNRLWRNRADGTFEDTGARVGLSHGKSGAAQAAMGVALGDVDLDGGFDLYITNFSEDYNTLYSNLGRGLFADATMRFGIGMASWEKLGWACGFVDWDNDADLDLFCVNGHVFPQVDGFESGTTYAQANQLFENVSGRRFIEVGTADGSGFGGQAVSRGAAWADFDDDGDIDLLVSNLDAPPTLLRNDTPARGHWLRIELEASTGHRAALGALVEVRSAGRVRRFSHGENSGFLSSSDPRVHIGLGDADTVESLQVDWPSGDTERFEVDAVDCTLRLVQGAGQAVAGRERGHARD